jgi:hypothetical protein
VTERSAGAAKTAVAAGASPVLALLDDIVAGASAIELSSRLARLTGRELTLVYVESERSLVAAALPFTQVLQHPGSGWMPLHARDVERGFQAHAARLRELASGIAARHAVRWSLRVLRGSLPRAAVELQSESDLLLLAATPLRQPPALGARRSAPPVVVAADDSPAGERATHLATQLARALEGGIEIRRVDAAWPAGDAAAAAGVRLLVLARPRSDAAALALLSCPVLLVG